MESDISDLIEEYLSDATGDPTSIPSLLQTSSKAAAASNTSKKSLAPVTTILPVAINTSTLLASNYTIRYVGNKSKKWDGREILLDCDWLHT